jgi:hypothetical protein
MNPETCLLFDLHCLRKELTLQPLFNNCKIHPIEDHDLSLHFETPLSMEMLRYYSRRIQEIKLPSILVCKIYPPPEVSDYTELMENWSSLFISGNWSDNFCLWLRHQRHSFLNVKELNIPNLLEIVEVSDLPLLKKIFPNLKLLRYGRRSAEDPMKEIFPPKILESFFY